jgi:dipeptidyl aminopeptidase/acylaminoacyl peptidase
LYDGWRLHLERKYEAQKQAILARGLRQGRRLTRRGFIAKTPVFMPDCGQGGGPRLVYVRDDGNTTSGIYSLELDAEDPDDSAQLIARSGGQGLSVDRDCSLYFDNSAPSKRLYYFNDLFRQPANTRSSAGTERSRQRLTVGARARTPDVSPDGRWLSYVTNRAGTSTLRIAHLDAQHELEDERALVPSADTEQAYSPRFSPDGKQLAYSAWTRGGYRDIRIVDTQRGSFYEVTHDRAIDQQPVWAPDGKTLYFVSDRTGIANVFAYELASHELKQVTNVLTGAYMPAISNDGRRMVYVGYGSYGFDLYDLELDPKRFIPAPEPLERPQLARRQL